MFLVKEEDPLVLDEPQAFPGHGHSEITEEGMRAEGSICLEPDGVPLGDRESRDLGREAAASVSPLVLDVGIPGCGQCLFFRVKEEEREVALDPPEREHSLPVLLVSGASGLDPQPDPSQTDAEVPLVAELNPGSFPDSGGIWVSVSPGCGPEDGVAEIEECEQDGERQTGTQQNMYVCTGQGDQTTEQQSTEELLEFLRQNPDTEPSESSDSEPEGEACAMACYLDNRSGGHISTNENRRKKQDCTRFSQSQGRPGDSVTQESGGAGGRGRTPFEYFSQYLDWKTWEEIARCTPALSNTPSSVSAKEVAQFVGIHIAMGTLKFPDKKLYWQDLTRVPLIADTMTASRFDQLACKLRLACRDGGEDGGDGNVRGGVSGVSWAEGRRDQLDTGNMGAERPVTAAPLDRPDGDVSPASRRMDPARPQESEPGNELVERSSGDTPDLQRASAAQSEHSHNTRSRTHHTRKLAQAASDARTECHGNAGGNTNDSANSNAVHGDVQRSEDGNGGRSNSKLSADPLWQVRGLLSRVQAGCQALTREGNYGVDQHLLHLGQRQRGRSRKNSHLALQCTFLVGAGGSVLDFDLSLDDSGREDVLRRMIPGSKESNEGLAFLCKEDLCTPAVLERLLVAGVRSAGRIGGEGARVGTGDEFVSSDGRLTLLRCPRGFVLTTLTKRQAQQVSLVRDLEAALKDAQLNRDLLELYRTPLSSSSPAQWPLAVFWHLTDLALVNSWLQFRKDRGLSRESRRNLMAFRLEVAKALIHGTNGAETVPYSAPPPPSPKTTQQGPIPVPSSPLGGPSPRCCHPV
ncbi:hypothetical protein AGOR_G00212700 [Albula goreensis]|uniref:PiggyBac transposable element-derived protein domain-containing protein n=1 Tax=Albula goreensis TaxID=1534307 RepID=A0A8T3CRW3_9TELE|nr:hypothetical protein AGOR_G00212700 [Albula goreensis]